MIDGVTATTDWTVRNGFERCDVTAGWLAGQAVDKTIRRLLCGWDDNLDHEAFVTSVYKEWRKIRYYQDFPEDELVGAAYAIYVPWANNGHGEIWALADCVYRYELGNGNHLSGGTSLGHSRDANLRKEAIRGLISNGKSHTDAELARIGRERMKKRRAGIVSTSGTWLDSLDKVTARAKTIHLPKGVTKLTLATDGFIVPPRSIEDGLASLAAWRERDPLCIGRNGGLCTAKGFVDENTGEVLPFTDDVGILVASM